jgi:putative tricarboxylic transport membrane protein
VLLVLSIVAAYAAQQSLLDLFAAVVFGLAGYVLRLFRYPLVNLMIGFVLGRLLETSFTQSLMMRGGRYDVFIERPMTVAILAAAALLLAVPMLKAIRNR